MSKVVLVAAMADTIEYNPDYDYVGIDSGALFLLNKKIPMVKAIGDFDSIDDESYQRLKDYCQDIECLNKIKDDSDSEHALRWASIHYDDITIVGIFGGRMDHFMAIYRLLEHADFKFTIMNDNNIIKRYDASDKAYQITKYKPYLSLFAIDEALISISGVKYPLDKQLLKTKDIYSISNEIVDDQAILNVHLGKVIVIQSSDIKKRE